MNRRTRNLVAEALLLGLILVGGVGAQAQAGTPQSVYAVLSQSTATAAPGAQIVYQLEFHNTGDTTVPIDPMVFTWQAPAHTLKVSGSADFGASVAPHSINTASLTVQVRADAPNGAAITMAAYPTTDGESMQVSQDPQVATVVGSTVGAPSSVSITAPTSVTWPAKATVGGHVTTPAGTSYAGQPASLFTADQSTSRRAAVVNAGSGGSLAQQLQLTRRTSVWWTAGDRSSPSRTVSVKPALTATRSAASAGHGGTIHVTGRTTPVRAGAPIRLQRLKAGTWTTIKTVRAAAASTSTSVASGTAYDFGVSLRKGHYTVRVLVPADDGRLAAASPRMALTFG